MKRRERMMRGHYSDRRYSDDELRRIFEAAAHTEVQAERSAQRRHGYTLDDLREIALEVGIDPVAVERAAADVAAAAESDPVASRSPYDRVIHEEVVIPRALTDAEMRRVVMQAETVIGRHGSLREAGDWVEWRDPKATLYVGLVRGGSQTRIRVIGDYSAEIAVGAGTIGVLAAFFGIGFLGSGGPAGLAIGVLILLAGPLLASWYWRRRSASGRSELRELLAILESTVVR
jgi:hypothetical protein